MLTSALAFVGLVVVAPQAPSQAVNQFLCTGYDACARAGYSSAGYDTAGSTMYWQMYGGHNCTNYAAYRMVRSGMPNVRPWKGAGNGTNWGEAMADITDGVPRVGAVAWWRANTPGAGKSGHVAYVEQVISPTEIIISEDMWGGDFHWRRISQDSGRWPAGFIHFNDVELRPSTPPSVSGTPVVGRTVSARLGAWPSGAKLSMRWYADGKALPGVDATRPTLQITPALLKKRLRVRVAATKPGFANGVATSPTTSATAPGTLDVATPPAVTGTPQVGETVSVAPAEVSPTPEAVTTQWLADGTPIDGATGPTLTVAPELVGADLTAVQTATATGYRTATLKAAASAPVAPGVMTVRRAYGLSGTARVGRTLAVSPGAVTPADATARYAWLRDGTPIDGADQASYQLQPDDVGRVVTARIMLERAGYRNTWLKAATNGPVTTTPTLSLSTTTSRGGALVVAVRLSARGVSGIDGPISAQVGSLTVQGALQDGRARMVLRGIPAGRRVLEVVYDGTDVVEAAHVRTAVTIPKRR
ncbi:CHAP domain-containing protein [Nocardioides sp. TRM66260-LWL]|uniref:CHAP domain-containing protein n=1 Tax=Nocardioides sp. TRM66260-LWL TaxID=2874478 RepID=UPI001CC7CD47|nr:CHAP domain-containing protein [Nocardioides sp. TRM66260-LWL]MBZ5733015.1 CHAP domain-containing protein [Nocardioides sp. TRM66260-LWL]